MGSLMLELSRTEGTALVIVARHISILVYRITHSSLPLAWFALIGDLILCGNARLLQPLDSLIRLTKITEDLQSQYPSP